MHDFVICSFFAVRASLMISINILTSLRLFVEKKFLRSRRACASTKSQKSKNVQHVYTIDINIWKYETKWTILWFAHFCCEIFLDDLKKNFNKPQIICRETISEIPQSRSCLDQNTKVKKRPIYAWNLTQTL